MTTDWVKIWSTADTYQAELWRLRLEAEGLTAFVINKQNPAYPVIGEAELYTTRECVLPALRLLKSATYE